MQNMCRFTAEYVILVDNLGCGGMRFPVVLQSTFFGISLHTNWSVFSQAVRNMQFRVGAHCVGVGTGRVSGMGPAHFKLKRRQLFVGNV